MDNTNGSLFITVEPTGNGEIHCNGKETTGASLMDDGRKFEAAKLESVLKEYGDLSSFKILDDATQGEAKVSRPLTFFLFFLADHLFFFCTFFLLTLRYQIQVVLADFYDARAARDALIGLNGRVFPGVKLRLFRQSDDDQAYSNGEDVGRDSCIHPSRHATSPVTVQNCIPFPKRHVDANSVQRQEFGSGEEGEEASRDESSSPEDVTGRERPRSASAGDCKLPSGIPGLLVSVPSIGVQPAPLPVYTNEYPLFHPVLSSATYEPSQLQDMYGRRHSIQHLCDAGKSVPDIKILGGKVERRSSIAVPHINFGEGVSENGIEDAEEGWMGHEEAPYSPVPAAHTYPHQQYNFPSVGPVSGRPNLMMGHGPFPQYSSVPGQQFYTTSPTAQYSLPPSSPPTMFPAYDYDQPFHLNAGMNMNWAPTQPMMMDSASASASNGMTMPWFPNAQGLVGACYHHHHHQVPPPPLQAPLRPHPYPFRNTVPTPMSASLSAHLSQDVYAQGVVERPYQNYAYPASSSSQSSSLPGQDTLPSPSCEGDIMNMGHHLLGSSAEHNHLDLRRIESGRDTRTTVMVKNIPNKMSDKDLLAYIWEVVPHKIDFLYLRIDFRNGEWWRFFG